MQRSGFVAAFIAVVVLARWAEAGCGAGCGCATCVDVHVPCETSKTVLEQRYVTETRSVTIPEYSSETRERTVSVMTLVPRTEEVSRTVTVLEPVTRFRTVYDIVEKTVVETKTEEYTVEVPTTKTVEKSYTTYAPQRQKRTASYVAMIPYTEERWVTERVPVRHVEHVERRRLVRVPTTEEISGCHTVRRMVAEQSTRTVVVRGGRWETRGVEMPAAGGPGCPRVCCRREWVPSCEVREEPVTTWRCVTEQVPWTATITRWHCEWQTELVPVTCWHLEERTRLETVVNHRPERRQRTYTVSRIVPVQQTYEVEEPACRTETRTREVTVARCIREPVARQVEYTELVPRQKTETYVLTTYDRVPKEVTETYTVSVPRLVTLEVPVQRSVLAEVTVPLDPCRDECRRPACDPCGGRGAAGHAGELERDLGGVDAVGRDPGGSEAARPDAAAEPTPAAAGADDDI